MQMFSTTLSAVCTLVTDGTHDTPKKQAVGFPLVKAKNVSAGRIDFDECDCISASDHKKVISRSHPQNEDVLFVNIGASLGDSVYIQGNREFSIKNIALFKPNREIIAPRYLYYVVRSPQFQMAIKNSRSGSAQPFIGLDALRRHPIFVHRQLDAQRRIASILGAYDDLIENNTRRIAILEEMARRLYEEWFVRFRFPGHEQARMVESPLGPIPEGWEVGHVEDLIVLQRGFDLPAGSRQPGEVPVLAATGQHGTHSQAKVRGPGLVTGRSGTIGKLTYVQSDFWPLNTTLWVKEFRCRSVLYSYYLLSQLDLYSLSSGAAVPTLNRNFVHRLPAIAPPESLVMKFDTVAKSFVDLIDRLRRQSRNLRTQRDLLLPKLVSGEIDVSEVPAAEEVAAA